MLQILTHGEKMNFLDKITEVTNKILDKVDKNVERVNKTYKEEGLSSVVEKTIKKVNKELDRAAEKAVQYYEDVIEEGKASERTNASKNAEPNGTKNATKNATKDTSNDTTNKNEQQKQDNVPVKPRKLYLQEIIGDGEIATLNYTPLEIVLETLQAQKSKRLPGHYKTARGNAIQLIHNKWYSFNGVGSEGAVNFVKYALNDEKSFVLEDKNLDDALTNDALQLLDKLHKTPDYQIQLSKWIKMAQKNKIKM